MMMRFDFFFFGGASIGVTNAFFFGGASIGFVNVHLVLAIVRMVAGGELQHNGRTKTGEKRATKYTNELGKQK